MIPYGSQKIDEQDIEAVVSVLRSPFITQGPQVVEFESQVAKACGVKHAAAFNSGTSALHAAMYAAGIKPGDEVITTPLTFVATSNAAVFMGALPVFVDVDPASLCIDIDRIEAAITPRTRAIVPVDFAGFPVNIEPILEIAGRHELVVIEDAAHALGAMRGGRLVGMDADMTMFSFHPVKHITTGEGGMIVCNQEASCNRLRSCRGHGVERELANWEYEDEGPWYYEMQDLGYNFRMTDIQAALGISQLDKLPQFIKKRQEIAAHYDEVLQEIPWLKTAPRAAAANQHAYHLYPILLAPEINRKDFFCYLRANGIGVQVHYIPVHLQPYYQRNFAYRRGDFPTAEEIYAREVSLPIFPGLTEEEQAYVIQIIKKYK